MDQSLAHNRRREPPRKSSSLSRAPSVAVPAQDSHARSLGQSLFVLAAILTLALRPYSFGLLTPRIEALKAEEKRLLLLGLRARSSRGTSTGLDRALGRSGWRGASPTPEEQEKWLDDGNGNGNGNGNESDEEDNGCESLSEGEEADESELAGLAKVRDSELSFRFLSRPGLAGTARVDHPILHPPVRSGPPHPRAFAPAAGSGNSLQRCVRSDGPRPRLRVIPRTLNKLCGTVVSCLLTNL